MTTNQEGVHAAVRAVTGTSRSYNEDWHALFDDDGIATGPFNARMLAWINASLSTSYSNLNEAMQAFAVDQGFANWSSMNTFDVGSLADDLLGSETNGLAFYADDMSLVIRDTTTPANVFSGDANDGLVYTGQSTKNVLDVSGVYEAGTTLRCEYDASGNPLGVRIEEGRTNLLLRSSNAFNNAVWSKNNTTCSDSNASSPFGSLTASLVTHTFTNSYIQQQVTAATGTYTAWAIVKAGNVNFFAISIFDSAHHRVWFNLSAGTIGTTEAGVTARMTSLGDGWYLCSNTYLTTAANPYQSMIFVSADNTTITANGNTGYICHTQFELGSSVTSPIITAGSSVTRAVDEPKILLTDFYWNGGSGNLEVNGIVTTPTTSGGYLLVKPRSGEQHVRTFKWVPA